MKTIHRQIAFHRLTKSQQEAKLKKDSEYKIDVLNLTVAYKNVPHTDLTWEAFQYEKHILWHECRNWAISQGWYEKVTPEQQLVEAEDGLNRQLEEVNLIRVELKKPKKKLIEEL